MNCAPAGAGAKVSDAEMARAALEEARRPLTPSGEHDGRAVEGALEALHREREGASAAEAAAHEHR